MPLRTVALVIAVSLLAGCQGALPSPTGDVNTAQALLDVAQSLNTLREENAMMQAQIDSLRGVVAYQDTVVRQLAAVGGVTMRALPMAPPQ